MNNEPFSQHNLLNVVISCKSVPYGTIQPKKEVEDEV